ncbi:GNAT family N-acetyltransferase [Chitinophaga nivalis]|uniref:GNAT family N-acetyltransferase n=1 Tax=Chitinophaga nivalis TaxID=2991709 RepID=A0ABT3INY3_9BACT|nr:GNAT family N-acetyltransferase [Chitinophaga nivalis]MCW3464620.1 GNAT family N-acetyltransferase [Chitinophaga nivalis]MCW3485689.1 GNAT family N-acetyltransferase [Chitinophaga nivalis]
MPWLKDLYYNTITPINVRDYNAAQIAAWASTAERVDALRQRIEDQYFYVAENDARQIIGFASLTSDGEIDMLYVHKDFQGCGVASRLLQRLLDQATELGLSELVTYASITARPFFEKRGFTVVELYPVTINDVTWNTYEMKRS